MAELQLHIGLLQRLAIDLACTFVLVRGIYYRVYGRGDQLLTLVSFNIVIFLIAYLLNRVEMTMGAAFGLFAVFSMLRYRTEGISTTDMTYLFLVIALGLIMAISPGGWIVHALTGVGLILCIYALESGLLGRRVARHEIWYDNVQLIHSASRRELIADLHARTGLAIFRVDVQEIDFLKDAARLTIFFHPAAGAHETIDAAERSRGAAAVALRPARADEPV